MIDTVPATDADWQGLPGRVLGRTDRGSEFFGYDSTYLEMDKPKTLVEFEKVAAEEGVQKVEASPRDGNKGNGICERHHRTIFRHCIWVSETESCVTVVLGRGV